MKSIIERTSARYLCIAYTLVFALSACGDEEAAPPSTPGEPTRSASEHSTEAERCDQAFPLRSPEEAMEVISGGADALDACEDETVVIRLEGSLGECIFWQDGVGRTERRPPGASRPEHCEELQEQLDFARACFSRYWTSLAFDDGRNLTSSSSQTTMSWYPECNAEVVLEIARHPTVVDVYIFTSVATSVPGD